MSVANGFKLILMLVIQANHTLISQESIGEKLPQSTLSKSMSPIVFARSANEFKKNKSDFETNEEFIQRVVNGAKVRSFLVPIKYKAEADSFEPAFFYSANNKGFILYDPFFHLEMGSGKKVTGSYTGTNSYGVKSKITKTYREESFFNFVTVAGGLEGYKGISGSPESMELSYESRLHENSLFDSAEALYCLIPIDPEKARKKISSYAFLVEGLVFSVTESLGGSSPTISDPEDAESKKFEIKMDAASTIIKIIDLETKGIVKSIHFVRSALPKNETESNNKLESDGVLDFEFSQLRVKVEPPAPPYPPLARIAKIQGDVVVEVVIGPDGVPRSAIALEGPVQLRFVAQDYAMRWRFDPVIVNGVPKGARFRLTKTFTLSK